MLGTIVNAAAILLGGFIGLLLQNGLRENYRTILNQAVALAVLFVGISGAVAGLLQPDANPVLFIICLAAGGLLGEWLRIEGRLETLGGWLQNRLQKGEGQSNLSRGFVAASLLFCTGTMAILGAFESGTQGNHSILFAKALMDGLLALVMASTLGVGVLFSAASVTLYQGALTLLASLVSPWLTADMMREISITGGILIAALGLNLLGLTKIKAGNLLPALLGPVIYYGLSGLLK